VLLVLLVALALLLSACGAGSAAALSMRIDREYREVTLPNADKLTPVCSSEATCTAMWKAAREWVAEHSPLKFKIASDELLQTFDPRPLSVELAMAVTKQSIGNGQFKIILKAWCNSSWYCTPPVAETQYAFNKAIGSISP
jgi:hypothetical protein